MVSLVLGLFLCLALALVVVGLVAVPARRAGREVLTERGEEVLGSIRDRQLLPARFGRTADGVGEDGLQTPADLAAWCRMRGQELVSAAAPRFVVRRLS